MLLNKNLPCCCIATFETARVALSPLGAGRQNLARNAATGKTVAYLASLAVMIPEYALSGHYRCKEYL